MEEDIEKPKSEQRTKRKPIEESHPDLFETVFEKDKGKVRGIPFRECPAVRFNCPLGHTTKAKKPITWLYKGNCEECNRVKRSNKLIETFKKDYPKLFTELRSKEVNALSEYVDWECSLGHEYSTSINLRVNRNNGCPVCGNKVLLKGFNDASTMFPELVSFVHPEDRWKLKENTVGGVGKVRWTCEEGHETYADFYNKTRGKGCLDCYLSSGTSKAENELYDFLKSYAKVVRGDRGLLDGLEVDLYLPDHNFAVEYNGCYWHSEVQGKDRLYHRDKVRKASEKGVQLVHVWEDDWRDKRSIVEELLLRKIGRSFQKIVGARSLKIQEVSYNEAKPFMEQTHLQGSVSASMYLALVDTEVRALMAVTKRGAEWEIVRYSTDSRVPGGFSKLLKAVESKLGSGRLYSFSDNMVSSGELYSLTGFVRDRELSPDYSYLVGESREHKFGYRKKRFENDPNLLWKPGLTERELAELNGLERIWDAGKIRWVRDF